jgi:short-chain fatty acids transporter
MATLDESLKKVTAGSVTEAVPITDTIFSMYNIIICLAILVIFPIVCAKMHPSPEDTVSIDPKLLEDDNIRSEVKPSTPAEKMEHSRLLSLIIGAIGLVYIFFFFAKNGFNLNLNIVNTIFLILGIILHGTPLNYVKAVEEAAKGAAGIILQFPFYAGIMGMMTGANADGVSLASVISNFFVNIATVRTFPLFTFWSAGIVNFFVPSGGGQWSVQGPIMLPAARELGVDPGLAAMGIAWGDAWTNLLQPFWALPALGLAKLGARDIMGYCVITLLVSGIIISAGLLLLV